MVSIYRQVRLSLIFSFLLCLIACAPAASQTPSAPTLTPLTAPSLASTPAPVVGRAATDFDAHRAFEQNQMLAVTIGKRVAGTENGVRAGDYIAQQLASFGYTVQRQPFDFQSWEDRGTRLAVTAPESRIVDARPIQYSPAGSLEAELTAVPGNGTASDFAGTNVRGRVVLVARGTIPFSEKGLNAGKAGALAVLIYNNQPGGFGGTLRDRVPIPTIGLSGADGRALLNLLSKDTVKVKLESNTATQQKTGYNIVGSQPGSVDGIIILDGHYDSVDAGPGAVDNGSGTAVLLELARVLGQRPHKNTFTFIAFDAEELGLLGSQYYVQNLDGTERSRIKGMLNFDMLGGGSGPLLAGGDGDLGKLTREASKQMGIEARNFALGGNSGSDHESFQRVGIDTVFFSRDYSLLHTPQDTIDQIQENYLGEAGRAGERAALEFDGATGR